MYRTVKYYLIIGLLSNLVICDQGFGFKDKIRLLELEKKLNELTQTLVCDCDTKGSYGASCNSNGQCYCKEGYFGAKCAYTSCNLNGDCSVTSIAPATSTTATSTTFTTTDPTTTKITLTLPTSTSTTTMTTKSTSANRFLVVSGYLASSSGPSTEVIDLANASMTCNSFGELDTTRAQSVCGLLGNTPIVCGGESSSIRQSCLIFGQSQTMTMIKPRYGAASVVLNTTTMWVMGGYGNGYLSSTEFITLEKAVSGPSLPHAVSYHCAVKFNESQIYVIGGYVNGQYTNDVYVFNPLDNFSYIYHSTMNYQRGYHGCAVMKDGESLVIVVVGGWDGNDYLDSVEILDPSLSQWIIGPTLPNYVSNINQAMVTSPDRGGVMIIGGKTSSTTTSPKILELRAGGSSWQEHDQELDNGRERHVVIPVPESITTCQ